MLRLFFLGLLVQTVANACETPATERWDPEQIEFGATRVHAVAGEVIEEPLVVTGMLPIAAGMFDGAPTVVGKGIVDGQLDGALVLMRDPFGLDADVTRLEGVFATGVDLPAVEAVFSDLDGDGAGDLALREGYGALHVVVARRGGPRVVSTLAPGRGSIAAFDLDGDGARELIAAGVNGDTVVARHRGQHPVHDHERDPSRRRPWVVLVGLWRRRRPPLWCGGRLRWLWRRGAHRSRCAVRARREPCANGEHRYGP
jgi:hypothetical protein